MYYTGTVFEARDAAKDGRALLGGGRYENLVGDVGGDSLPGVGFAMGDVMIQVILEKYGLIPALTVQPAKVVVTCFNKESLSDSYALASVLRAAGIKTLCYPEFVKLDRQLKYANRVNARAVIISGPDEQAAGKITIKDLENRTQMTVERNLLIETLESMNIF